MQVHFCCVNNSQHSICYFDSNLADSRRPSILPVPESFSSSVDDEFVDHDHEHNSDEEGGGSDEEAEDEVPWLGGSSDNSSKVIKGFPPVAPFIGVTPTLCYLLREKKQLCCLQLAQVR